MGFAINRSGSLAEPVLMTPTLQGSPRKVGVGSAKGQAPPGRTQFPVGPSFLPARRMAHERHHHLAGVRRRRRRGSTPTSGNSLLGVARPGIVSPGRSYRKSCGSRTKTPGRERNRLWWNGVIFLRRIRNASADRPMQPGERRREATCFSSDEVPGSWWATYPTRFICGWSLRMPGVPNDWLDWKAGRGTGSGALSGSGSHTRTFSVRLVRTARS